MKKLCYKTLEEQNYGGYLLKEAPERILQFGEGNFLRAFADYFVDVMNERCGFGAKIVAVQPVGRSARVRDQINGQEGLYTLLLRGNKNGQKIDDKRVISSISRCLNPRLDYEEYMACAENPSLRFIICNTTEAGIQYDPSCRYNDHPASSYPGKLTQFLHARYCRYRNTPGKGFVILACELIDDNGKALKECVLKYAGQWSLGDGFIRWVEEENLFCSTLVDRIVTGYPGEEAEALRNTFGYEDSLIDAAEVFGAWVIEGPEKLREELPFEAAGLPVQITDNLKPYKQRKVRILNGAHTSMALGAYLAGKNIVRDCMEDPVVRGFMERAVYEEIIPTLSLPESELYDFAKAVTDRFKNPFIDHDLLAIALNSTSKWRARVLPSLKEYVKRYRELPVCLTASLAFYIAFYSGGRLSEEGLTGIRGTDVYTVRDDRAVLEFFDGYKEKDSGALAGAVLSNEVFWGEDLTRIDGLLNAVEADLRIVERQGAYGLMKACADGV